MKNSTLVLSFLGKRKWRCHLDALFLWELNLHSVFCNLLNSRYGPRYSITQCLPYISQTLLQPKEVRCLNSVSLWQKTNISVLKAKIHTVFDCYFVFKSFAGTVQCLWPLPCTLWYEYENVLLRVCFARKIKVKF